MSIFARTLFLVLGTAISALIILILLTVDFSQKYINTNLNERLEALVSSQEIKVSASLDRLGDTASAVSSNRQLAIYMQKFQQTKSKEDLISIRKTLEGLLESSSVMVRIAVWDQADRLITSLGKLNNVVSEIALSQQNSTVNYGFQSIVRTSVGKTYLKVREPIFRGDNLAGNLTMLIDITSDIEAFYNRSGFGDKGFTRVFVGNNSGQWVDTITSEIKENIEPKIVIPKVIYDGYLSSLLNDRNDYISVHKRFPGRNIVIEVNISSDEVFSKVDEFYNQLFTAFVFIILATMFIAFMFSRQFTNPIRRLNRSVDDVAAGKKDVDFSVLKGDPLEIKTLSVNINHMAQNLWKMNENLESIVDERTAQLTRLTENLELTVDERTKEFQEANALLLKALEELHDTQNELVKSEKMASLGELVAGVAHEINTPLGVAVTGASQAQDQLLMLEKNKNTGALTMSTFDGYINESKKLMALMTEQLNVASSLIKNFKEVAVDQNNFDVRDINLKEYLLKIFDAVKPKYRPTKITLELQCDESYMVSTRPGAFSQVISNLLLNALLHAFDDGQAGSVTVKCTANNSKMKIAIIDDGRGISKDDQTKIFDPFFTTKRGQGGSGLGLSIVFNIVTEALHGKINVESKLGEGSQFIIEIPKTIDC